jgi:hypothetical protein
MLGPWIDALKKYYPPYGGARKQKTDLRPRKTEEATNPKQKEDLREHLDQKKHKPSTQNNGRGRGRGNGRGGRGGRGGLRQGSPEQRQKQNHQESPDPRQYGRCNQEPAKKAQDKEQRAYGRKTKK